MRRAIGLFALLTPFAAAASGAPVYSTELRVDDAATAQTVTLSLRHSQTRSGDAVAASGAPFETRALRESLDAAWRRRFDAWHVDAALRYDRVRGTGVDGGTFGSTGGNARAAVLRAPFDQALHEWRFSATHRGGNTLFRLEGMLAAFANARDALVWQNPFAAVAGWAPGAEVGIGELAGAPDNRAHDFIVAWAWRAPAGISIDLDAGLGRHEQDAPFLPYTRNAAVQAPAALPRASLGGRVDRRRLQARTRWQITRAAELDFRIRTERDDDRTAAALFLYPAGDTAHQPLTPASAQARWRLPRNAQRERVDAGWSWRSGRRDRLRVEVAHDAVERAYSEVAATRERRAAAEWRRTGGLNAHARVERSHRDSGAYRDNLPWLAYHTDAYVASVAPELRYENHPLLRRFNLADRERTIVRGGVGRSGDAWSVSLLGTYRDDAYTDSVFGLTASRQAGVHFDASYALSDAQHLSAWVSRERWESQQDGRHFRGGAFLAADFGNAERDWRAVTDDRVRGAGLAWRHTAPWPNGRVGVDLSRSRSAADVAVTAGAAIPTAPLPTVTAAVDRIALSLAHQVNARLSVRASLEHERWRARDWATDGVTPTTMAGVLGLADAFPDSSFSWASLSLEWRF